MSMITSRPSTSVIKIVYGVGLKLLVLSTIILSVPNLSYAVGPPTYYSYHENSVMTLGVGVDPDNPYERKSPCLEYGTYYPDGEVALQTFAKIKMTSSKEDLRIQLGVDSKAAARYLLFKAEGEQKIDYNRVSSSNSATFIIQFYTEFGRQAVENIKLSAYADKLLTDNKFDQFRRECGSQYVSMIRRGASVAAVITVHNIELSTKAQLSGQIGAGMELEFFGGEAKTKVSSALDTALRRGDLEVQVFSTGGKGFGDLKTSLEGFVQSGTKDAFTTIVTSIGNYIGQFNFRNAAPLGFHVTTMPRWNVNYRDLWNEDKDIKLIKLVDEFEQVNKDLRDVNGIIAGSDPRVGYLTQEQVKSLVPISSQLSARSSRISEVYTQCLNAPVTEMKRCNIEPSNIKLPVVLYPINKMPSSFAVIVDGTPWLHSQADEVLQDPGPGSLLEKVRIRNAAARSAHTAISFTSPYLSDISLIVRFRGKEYLQNVYYPGRSSGDRVVTKRSDSSYVTLQADPKGSTDWSLSDGTYRWFYRNYCVAASMGKPPLELLGTGDVIARARNRYGYVRDFQIARLQMYEAHPGIGVLLWPTSGQKPLQWQTSDKLCERIPDWNLLMFPDVPDSKESNFVLDSKESNFVLDEFGSRHTDKPTVCIVNGTAYPEGAIIDIQTQKKVCTNGSLRDRK